MIRRKVSSFTIMELTIAMLVTSVIIAITFTVYIIISRTYQDYTRKHEALAVLLQLDNTIKLDFMRASYIYKDSDRIAVIDSAGSIFYEVSPAYIFRTSSKNDTFKVKVLSSLLRFQNKTVDAGEKPAKTLIDELSFDVILNGDTISYVFHKSYSSADLIRYNSNAVN